MGQCDFRAKVLDEGNAEFSVEQQHIDESSSATVSYIISDAKPKTVKQVVIWLIYEDCCKAGGSWVQQGVGTV